MEQEVDRRSYLGGHDVSAILGVNPYRSPLQVFASKLGYSEEQPVNEYMWLGTVVEPAMREWYRTQYLNDAWQLSGELFVQHEQYPFLAGHPDGVATRGGEEDHMLEIKVVVSRNAKSQWGDPGSDQIPSHYLVQVAYYLMLTDLPYAKVAAAFVGDSKEVYRVDRNPRLEEIILGRCGEFWENHILKDVPPPVTDVDPAQQSKILDRLHPRATLPVMQATSGQESLAFEWRDLDDKIDDLTKRKDTIKALMRASLREAAGIQGRFGKINYSEVAGSSHPAKIVTALQEMFQVPQELMDQIKQQCTGNPSRKLTPYWRKEGDGS